MSTMQTNKVDGQTKVSEVAKILKDIEYDNNHTALSDKLLKQVSTFDMLINGLCHIYNQTSVGDEMKDEDLLALCKGWSDLKNLIKQREEG